MRSGVGHGLGARQLLFVLRNAHRPRRHAVARAAAAWRVVHDLPHFAPTAPWRHAPPDDSVACNAGSTACVYWGEMNTDEQLSARLPMENLMSPARLIEWMAGGTAAAAVAAAAHQLAPPPSSTADKCVIDNLPILPVQWQHLAMCYQWLTHGSNLLTDEGTEDVWPPVFFHQNRYETDTECGTIHDPPTRRVHIGKGGGRQFNRDSFRPDLEVTQPTGPEYKLCEDSSDDEC